jgi:hypothetical protein
MEHVTLLIVLLLVIAGGVAIILTLTSKRDPLDDNPMRGTTRREK